jgi:hypothetical protein
MSDTTSKIDDEFTASIEAAVEASVEADKQNLKNDNKNVDTDEEVVNNANSESDLPPKGDEVQGGDTSATKEVKDPEGDEIPPKDTEPISDELLERAVRSGITMRTARKFPDSEALEEALSLLERSSGNGDEGKEAPVKKDEPATATPGDIEALLNDIKIDPKEYDTDLVKSVEALKGAVASLYKQNQQLQAQGTATGFESNLATLDPAVAKVVRETPEKQTALRKKFDVLKAGYKAAGENLPDSDVFKEASQMVLSEDIAKAKTQSKSAQAQRRSTQLITRPSGKSVQPSAGSAEEEAAKLLKEKFNI